MVIKVYYCKMEFISLKVTALNPCNGSPQLFLTVDRKSRKVASHQTRGLQQFYLVLLHSLINLREIKLASLTSKSFKKSNKDYSRSRGSPQDKIYSKK